MVTIRDNGNYIRVLFDNRVRGLPNQYSTYFESKMVVGALGPGYIRSWCLDALGGLHAFNLEASVSVCGWGFRVQGLLS